MGRLTNEILSVVIDFEIFVVQKFKERSIFVIFIDFFKKKFGSKFEDTVLRN